MATDGHNDSTLKTLSAWSSPSRYLAQSHAENQYHQYMHHGLDAEFITFNPDSMDLTHLSPIVYHEMLSIVSKRLTARIAEFLQSCDCFAIQCDKSTDKYNIDSLFVTIRFMVPETFEMWVGYLGACHSDARGVQGMIEAIDSLLTELGIKDLTKSKLCGLATDGENANTDKTAGLWRKFPEYIGHGMLTIWCVAHS